MTIDSLEQQRNRFVATLRADVDSLIGLHKRDAKGAGRPGAWLRAIRRASIVLIGANLENFIEELVCTTLSHLTDQRVMARGFPEGYRVWRFRYTAQSENLGVDNAKQLAELALKLYSEVRELQEDELLLDTIKEKFANPTPKNVNWIMSLLDKPEYVNNLSVNVNGDKTSVVAALHELARRRNAIAHGDAVEDPSLEDVVRLAQFARRFSTRIKNDVSKVAEKCLER